MYTEFFGLRELPFGLTPNTVYFLNTLSHEQASQLLRVAIDNGEGFIKIVGEVGTGKTMLCRKLLRDLDSDCYTAYIPNPFLNPAGLYRALADELGLRPGERQGVDALQKKINQRLIELVGEGRRVVLVIDEAQAIPEKTLEALRLISNLETETRKLIQIVLFGQPELDAILSRPAFRQLRQRISFAYRLAPLDERACGHYIQHRLSTAGYNGAPLFSARAQRLIFRATGGVPRLINILCHKALLCAYGKGVHRIEKTHVLAAIRDTEGVAMPPLWARWVAVCLPVLAGPVVVSLAEGVRL